MQSSDDLNDEHLRSTTLFLHAPTRSRENMEYFHELNNTTFSLEHINAFLQKTLHRVDRAKGVPRFDRCYLTHNPARYSYNPTNLPRNLAGFSQPRMRRALLRHVTLLSTH